MNQVFKIIAWIGLVLTALGPVLVFTGSIDVEMNKKLMLAGMVLWFLGAGPWLSGKKLEPSDSQVEI